jgi:hypothetical protein
MIYVYMDVDTIFGVVFQMWDPKAKRHRCLCSQLPEDECDCCL